MAQLMVHGTAYEIPESFTLKEMRIMERYSEGHVDGYDISKMCAVIHIAMMRANPAVPFEEIQEVVDALAVDDLAEMFATVEAAGQNPPAPSKDESNESSNGASEPSSVAIPESEIPESTGSPISDGFQSFHTMSKS